MLKIRNLGKKLKDFALQDINLEIDKNEYFVILGPTGSGKTVLLELIAGLQKPDGGEIFWGEKPITYLQPEERKIAMVYQDYQLFPHLNVRENILFGLKVRNCSKKDQEQALDKIVSLFGIEHLLLRSTENLSGGELQRVALARALITSPEILLLDEPLSALDPDTSEKFQEDLKRLHKELGTTTLHVTHDFNEALYLAERLAVMRCGRILQAGRPEIVFQKPESDFIARFTGGKNIFRGRVEKGHQGKVVRINSEVKIKVVTEREGEVNLLIRPEDIIVSPKPLESSARNSLAGKLKFIQNRFSFVELKVDTGINLTVYITRQSLEEMKLREGSRVYLTFKASAVRVF